jgi:hypothetical protein
VEMPLNLNIIIEETKPMETTSNLPIDLDGLSCTCDVCNSRNETQIPLTLAKTIPLSHLPTRKIKIK